MCWVFHKWFDSFWSIWLLCRHFFVYWNLWAATTESFVYSFWMKECRFPIMLLRVVDDGGLSVQYRIVWVTWMLGIREIGRLRAPVFASTLAWPLP